MKKGQFVSVIAISLGLIMVIGVLVLLNLFTDSWTKDSRGVWIKKGNPPITPPEVKNQQDAIAAAIGYYETAKLTNNLTAHCLGITKDYAIHMIHTPHLKEDDLVQNKCREVTESRIFKVIEMDIDGNIISIIDS